MGFVGKVDDIVGEDGVTVATDVDTIPSSVTSVTGVVAVVVVALDVRVDIDGEDSVTCAVDVLVVVVVVEIVRVVGCGLVCVVGR